MKKKEIHLKAIKANEKLKGRFDRQSTNALNMNGAQLLLSAIEGILTHDNSPCSSCAQLTFNQESAQIGCSHSNPGINPTEMARKTMEGRFFYDLHCAEQKDLTEDHEVVEQDDVLSYSDYSKN